LFQDVFSLGFFISFFITIPTPIKQKSLKSYTDECYRFG
jgi:hypothetical protein